jgi:predicted aspartyl protease
MGRTVVPIQAQNYSDYHRMKAGEIPPEQIRTVALQALVDTGATMLCLPNSQITKLGLSPIEKRKVMTANGEVEREVYGGVFLTVMGRSCTLDVTELPETAPPLMGYLPLEALDFVVDPTRQRLIPNPAHDGKFMHDLF